MRTIFFILSGIFGIVLTRPQNPYHHAYITRYDNDNTGLGSYRFGFETSDGFRHDQTGDLKDAGTENAVLVMKGSYSYIGPDGNTYTVYYIADENGFQPIGTHLPAAAGIAPFSTGALANPVENDISGTAQESHR